MKKNYVLMMFALIFIFANVKAQDVTVIIKGLHDLNPVALDSIVIYNESNNSYLRIGSLAQDVTQYSVNLTNKSATGINKALFANENAYSVSYSDQGAELLAQLTQSQTLYVSTLGFDGRILNIESFDATKGPNNFKLSVPKNQIFLINIKSINENISFKAFNSSCITGTQTLKGTRTQNCCSIKKQTNSEREFSTGIKTITEEVPFTFIPGDRIQVYVKKESLKSGYWMGEPKNNDVLLLALPKTGAIFDMEQTLSGGAQRNTIAFSAVAFFSGCYYASTFYPPGKVADYFGFQYMRDNDYDESGHNTDFLTKAAYLMMNLLNESQMQKLIDLSQSQNQLFTDYAEKRLILIKAFHRYLENDLPEGKTALNIDSVSKVSKELYLIDGEISYERAVQFADIINSFTQEQKDSLYRVGAIGMQTWPMPPKPTVSIPKGLNVWVMSNASELFSWFLKGVEAGIYFCPERQGTYFGGFYMKDAPAVGTPGYAIDPQATANKGAYLMDTLLTTEQSKEIKDIYSMITASLNGIVEMRTNISTELRKAIDKIAIDKDKILEWSEKYGEYDAFYNYTMVEQFVKVGRTLTQEQKDKLVILRDLDEYPCKEGKVFIYSTEVDEPVVPNTDFLFK